MGMLPLLYVVDGIDNASCSSFCSIFTTLIAIGCSRNSNENRSITIFSKPAGTGEQKGG